MKTMMMTLAAVGVLFSSGCVSPMAQEAPPLQFTITETRPHICFVNAGTEIPQDAFDQAVSNACVVTHVRWTTVQAPQVTLAGIVVSPTQQQQMFGSATILVVYVVSDPGLPRLMNVPGQYALINILSMRNDTPGEKVFAGRMQRILMKALAYAAGVGANQDPICVMYWNSFSVGTIDSTSATYSPLAFFPLTDILRALGTEDMFESPEE